MKKVDEHTLVFSDIVRQTFADMLGIETASTSEVASFNSVETKKQVIISIHYTGTVFGEYLLALDESTAAQIIQADEPVSDENREEVRDEICDTLSEVLNVIVGEAIVDLQNSFAKLTFAAPRIFFGEVRYPNFRTGCTTLQTDAGEIECHFCLDLMRLNLAESYDTAMKSLLDINDKLKDANQQLAAQQAQLVHSEKMASIGVLAAGVAHEINTPLFAVDVNLATFDDYVSVLETTVELYENLVNSLGASKENLAQLDNGDDDLEFILQDTKSLLSESRESTTQIKRIVKKLKDISNLDNLESVPTDINQLAETVLSMLSEKVKDLEVEFDFGNVPIIECNAGEIGQVIINLVMNAADACYESGKTIKLVTREQDGEVLVSVVDDGCGIVQDDLGRIFDPFFTTKGVGSGSGLGLSVSFGIVQKHNGAIQVDRTSDEGTSVTFRLPVEGQNVGTVVTA